MILSIYPSSRFSLPMRSLMVWSKMGLMLKWSWGIVVVIVVSLPIRFRRSLKYWRVMRLLRYRGCCWRSLRPYMMNDSVHIFVWDTAMKLPLCVIYMLFQVCYLFLISFLLDYYYFDIIRIWKVSSTTPIFARTSSTTTYWAKYTRHCHHNYPKSHNSLWKNPRNYQTTSWSAASSITIHTQRHSSKTSLSKS